MIRPTFEREEYLLISGLSNLRNTWKRNNFPRPLILIPFQRTSYGPISDTHVDSIANQNTPVSDFFQGFDVVLENNDVNVKTKSLLQRRQFTIVAWMKGGSGTMDVNKWFKKNRKGWVINIPNLWKCLSWLIPIIRFFVSTTSKSTTSHRYGEKKAPSTSPSLISHSYAMFLEKP